MAQDLTRFEVEDGTRIPHRMCRYIGPVYGTNALYLAGAEAEAIRVINHMGARGTSRVLDIGCGQGRLATGLHRILGDDIRYLGLDIMEPSVEWCRLNITSQHPSYKFRLLDVFNARYNPDGRVMIDENFRFDVPDKSVDIVFLFSVFSHMTDTDAALYLRDAHRMLDDGGYMFFTTYFEDDVPDWVENPEGYICKWDRALHGVRYNRGYLIKMVKDAGFEITRLGYRTEVDKQSAMYLRKV